LQSQKQFDKTHQARTTHAQCTIWLVYTVLEFPCNDGNLACIFAVFEHALVDLCIYFDFELDLCIFSTVILLFLKNENSF